METSDNTILFKKGTGDVKDSLGDFGMATGDIEFPSELTFKEPGVEDCPGESGERTHFPSVLPVEAYDISVQFKYAGTRKDVFSKFYSFLSYLNGSDGGGSELSVYSPYYGVGRRGVWVKSVRNIEFDKDSTDGYLKFDAEFRVSDPLTEVTLDK